MKRREFLRAITGAAALPLAWRFRPRQPLDPLIVQIRVDSRELARSLRLVAPVAKMCGVSMEETTAILKLVKLGDSERAATSLRAVMARLALSHAQSGPGSLDRLVS